MHKFTSTFTEGYNYVSPGDFLFVDIDGIRFIATIEADYTYCIDDDDSHNPDQSVTGCNDEQQKTLLANRKAWENDEWFYCGIVISAHKAGVLVQDGIASLWGIHCNYPDSDNTYLTEVANELLQEAIEPAKDALRQLVAKLSA